MPKEITERQKELLEFIVKQIREYIFAAQYFRNGHFFKG